MYIDKLDTLQLNMNRIYEAELTAFFKKHLSVGDIVLDIGAHIGYYSLIFGELVGQTGKVYAFEPDPENYDLLSKNVKINRLMNIKVINKAVADRTGTLNLYESDTNSGDHRIYDSGERRKSIPIEAVKIDDLANDFTAPVKLIKMDIQGAEYFALKGMLSIIHRSNNLILCTEFWPYGLKMAGINPALFIELLFEEGFTLYEQIGAKKIKINSVSSLNDKYKSEDAFSYTNLICKKGIQDI
jgi:FkbM family methyltransferase